MSATITFPASLRIDVTQADIDQASSHRYNTRSPAWYAPACHCPIARAARRAVGWGEAHKTGSTLPECTVADTSLHFFETVGGVQTVAAQYEMPNAARQLQVRFDLDVLSAEPVSFTATRVDKAGAS